MLSKDFNSLLKIKHEEEEKLLSSKGQEYTIGDSDRLVAFKEIAKQKDKRCVDDICISSVSLEETSDGKLINIVIKNEGKYVVESSCVNLVTTEKKHIICLNKAKPNEDLQISLDYTENLGETIEDYSLEKASEKDAEEANKKREEILNNIN